jgi:hypothetical protein
MYWLETKNCASHRINQDYVTLLAVWTGDEDNVRPVGFTGNWQPRDDEFREGIEKLASRSPTFALWLIRFVENLQIPIIGRKVVPKKRIEKLEDLLL